ncbi:hypothetical protein E7744_14830 (plasmid) [Citricoccus sp. SGAir0253]|uniref:MFS transporter n=1 Tax=Citricoccus sp. SGAir0253 TaxID=2567881 RepID=UPI0010CCE8D2|nr:MFS transporter [Citricoccus sp. SGAir0253]QCU79594.1 hypothetical protein E7744_14830 [Citricoccus sp. SGAir0253]
MSAMGVAALMTSGVSALGPLIRADLGLSMAGLGLFAVAVFLSTAAGSVPLGRLADRMTPETGVAATYGCAALGLAG